MYNYGTQATVNGVEYMVIQQLQDGYALAVRLPLLTESNVTLIKLPEE